MLVSSHAVSVDIFKMATYSQYYVIDIYSCTILIICLQLKLLFIIQNCDRSTAHSFNFDNAPRWRHLFDTFDTCVIGFINASAVHYMDSLHTAFFRKFLMSFV